MSTEPETLPTAPDAAAEPAPAPLPDTFATYLAKRWVGDKGHTAGLPEEAAELAAACDVALTYGSYGLQLTLVVDREAHPDKRFTFDQARLLEVGKACLHYTGTINGAKLPVQIVVVEVAHAPLEETDRLRLKALAKIPGLQSVGITAIHVDTASRTTWSSEPFGGRLSAHRRWIGKLLKEPRKTDEEIFTPAAALPQDESQPFATWGILAFLVAMFVLEHVFAMEGEGSGLLGVNVKSLYALGGMNRAAVLDDGEWHRLLSAVLLHGDAFHLLLNGLALWLAGTLLEALVGPAWFGALFLVGGLGGSLLGLALNPTDLVSIGASGAVMGLLASTLVLAMRLPVGSTRAQVQGSVLQFLIPSLLPLAVSRTGGKIDYAAHFGGAIAGAAFGWIILQIWPRESERPRFTSAARGVSVLAIIAFGWALFTVQQGYAKNVEVLSIPPVELLVDDANIPQDTDKAIAEVETWGAGHERDPRVRMYRAMGLADREQHAQAEAEARAGLAEEKILKAYFPNRWMETALRTVLADALLDQGREDDAKAAAKPVCESDVHPQFKEGLTRRGLCPGGTPPADAP